MGLAQRRPRADQPDVNALLPVRRGEAPGRAPLSGALRSRMAYASVGSSRIEFGSAPPEGGCLLPISRKGGWDIHAEYSIQCGNSLSRDEGPTAVVSKNEAPVGLAQLGSWPADAGSGY